jgi:predicted RNase H-like nuclease (RuvC/YqgF family)
VYLIVGVDPGTTKGVAALDFKGNVVGLLSGKEMGLDAVLSYLIGLGTVSVVATDVCPAPDFVLKVASQLGAIVYVPAESAKVVEKMEATKHYSVDDTHQRDALSAALIAFASYKNKFIKIDSLDLGTDAEDIKHLVVQGISISEAQKQLAGFDAPTEVVEKPQSALEVRPQTAEEKMIRMLEKQNHVLRSQLLAKDDEITRLRDSVSRIKTDYSAGLKKDTEVVKKDIVIRDLKNTITNLRGDAERLEDFKRLWSKVLSSAAIPVEVYPKKKKGYLLVRQRLSESDVDELKGADFVFTDSEEMRRMLRGRRIKVSDSSSLKELAGCFYILASDIEAIDKADKESNKPHVSIDGLVDKYRQGRRLSV